MRVNPRELVQESYAANPKDVRWINTVTLDHPGFVGPLYFVQGVDVDDPGETVMLPIVASGDGVAHLPCAFSITEPGYDEDGATDGKITVDDIASEVKDALRSARGYNSPLLVTYRQYRVPSGGLGDITGPDLILDGLQIMEGSIDVDEVVSGTLTYPDVRLLNVPTGPDAFFDRDNYPGLFP